MGNATTMIGTSRFGDMVLLGALVGAAALAYITRNHTSTPYDKDFDELGKKWSIPPNLLRAIAKKESNFNPNALNPDNSVDGNERNYPNGSRDIGLMQVNSSTGKHYGYSRADLLVPRKCIECACRVLIDNRRDLGAKYSIYTWPASYNVGPDLTPVETGERYAAEVVYHWQLYDAGRMLA
jgi:soluble lytic murein transglycosylase-like protein